MSDLSRRPSPKPRRTREQRAYRLVMIGSGAGVVGVAGLLLALIGVIGFAIPLIAIVVAVACLLLFRSTVGG
ncbi:MAG TPA: hypothetical protein VF520_03675 [Thermoleophilaceae bacterium]